MQSILRTWFTIFANSDESKSLDFSDDFHSSVFAKKLKKFEFYSEDLFRLIYSYMLKPSIEHFGNMGSDVESIMFLLYVTIFN